LASVEPLDLLGMPRGRGARGGGTG